MIADPRLHLSVSELSDKDRTIGPVQCIDAMVLAVLVLSDYNDTIVSVYATVSCSLSLLEVAPIDFAVRLVAYATSLRSSFIEGSDHESFFIGLQDSFPFRPLALITFRIVRWIVAQILRTKRH